jgi:glycosyltransferase involved in cell wall biosynthesis
MLVERSITGDSTVLVTRKTLAGRVRPLAERAVTRLQRSANTALHSCSLFPGRARRTLELADSDVINLHWTTAGFLSIEQIGKLRPPIVWTLHDMWTFSGAEHLAPDDANARWRLAYSPASRTESDSGVDLNRLTWLRKQRAWKQPFHLVAPSRWLASCAESSSLFGHMQTSVIPIPIDVNRYRPHGQQLAREILSLPPNCDLVLFGALGGVQDRNKGWDLLQPALEVTATRRPGTQAVVFGQKAPARAGRLGLPVHWMGPFHDDVSLALLYSAVDVVVVPSRQEALGQVGVEAQCCGTPVVAFDTTGLKDVIDHKVTGYLATPFDSIDLAAGIHWLLDDIANRERLSEASRKRATRLWSSDAVAQQYTTVYRSAIESQLQRAPEVRHQ